ncbi:MAG TPA: diacylglycerol kinase family protein [Candidatus Tumulicola sp.]|nr:diacylglycerol kinase family protein [Candidatus Tumulicola sp.]
MRALVIVNKRSRFGLRVGAAALRTLSALGIQATPFDDRAGSPTPPCDCIVSVGGDGTLLRAIRRATGAGVPIGIVPAGTFNELARTLKIPFGTEAACAVIAAGRVRQIDVGLVNGVHYVNEASIGISSRAARFQTTALKRRFGVLAVAATALRALWYARPMYAEVAYDGGTVTSRTIQLTVANSNRFGGVFAASGAAIDDGWLDLYSVEIAGFWKALPLARAILAGKGQGVPGLLTLRAKEFSLRQHRRHHITADGEPAGTTPATFRVLPKALRVYVPE